MSSHDDALAVAAGDGDVASSCGALVSTGQTEPAAPGLPPLAISALMVRKADLIVALRVYLPQISDIEAIDGERFLLSVSEPTAERGGT
jgi:hypothetical protein